MEVLARLFNVTLIVATLRTTAPILLVALGGSFTTRAGIFNIGLEGQMLVGAFFAVIGAIFSGSPWIGMGCGVLAALVLAYLFALLVVTFKANEVVVGLALNILASGMTILLLKAIFGTRGSIFGHGLVGLPAIRLPYARDLGWFGQMISGYTPLVYAAFILAPLLIVFYNRARLGLYIRVVGENPEAAESLGISIERIRYTASLLCGTLAGFAGAHLSLGYTTMFTENMSSGRGFMAVAILDLLERRPVEDPARLPAVRLLGRSVAPASDFGRLVLSGARGSLSRRARRLVRAFLPGAPPHDPGDAGQHGAAVGSPGSQI